MKCRRKATFEYCPVEHILPGPAAFNLPDWVHEAFRRGVLKIKEMPKPILHLRPDGPIPSNSYLVRIGETIEWEPEWNFKLKYEIID